MSKKIKRAENKEVLDKEVESSIRGFSLVIAFFIVGIFLQVKPELFGAVTKLTQIAFILVGILGLFTEVKTLNEKSNIMGMEDVVLGGALLLGTYYMGSVNTKDWFILISALYNLLMFFILLISSYGFSSGIIKMIYSLYKNKKQDSGERTFSNIILVLSQLAGIVLIVFQIYEIFSK